MFGKSLRRREIRRPLRKAGGVAAVLALIGVTMVIPAGGTAPVAQAAGEAGSQVTQTHDLKTWKVADPSLPVLNRTLDPVTIPGASVTVSQTRNLQQRQVISVSWQGFTPSVAGSATPLGGATDPGGDPTNFPVVILQCWGTDTGSMDPRHCQGPPFLSGGHRLLGLVPPVKYAMTNGADLPNPTDVVATSANGPDTLGFEAVDGTHYDMVGNVPPSMPASLDAPLPNNAVSTFTDATGARTGVQFEVRGGSDLPVLGCSFEQDCTLEVIPIVRPYCNPSLWTGAPVFRNIMGTRCLQEPAAQDLTANPFLSADGWWLSTQWQNRFSFPLKMAPRSGECPVVDQRPTVTIQGSEPMQTAMVPWGANFCLDPRSAFKVTQSVTPEDAARTALTSGNVKAAFTSLPVTGAPQPVVHAPVAATGWTVAYLVDDKNGQQYHDLTLSPLLLAKLITDSYATDMATAPGVAGNPKSLFLDPEFQALNPGFASLESRVNVTWLSQDSDLFAAMFDYIDADPEARAFLDGAPDPYSHMIVNPEYRGKLKPPQQGFQQLDSYVDYKPDGDANGPCSRDQPIRLYDEWAQYAISLDAGAQSVLSRKAPFQLCKTQVDGTHSWGNNGNSQPIGGRHVLAFTSVPMAEQYGLSMAKLQSHFPGSKGVAPGGWESAGAGGYSTIQTALGYTKQDKATGVTSPDYAVFPYNNSYAGTTAIYAAVPTCGLDATLAGRLADFLDFAAGPGQTPGTLSGQLPPGFAPLPAAYTDYTKTAADAVRHQTCTVPAPPADFGAEVRNELGLPAPGASAGAGFGGALGPDVPGGTPAGGAPAAGPAAPGAGAPVQADTQPQASEATRGSGSRLGDWGLLVLLIVGLAAGLVAPVVRMAGQPGHPLRRFFASVGRWIGGATGKLASAVRRQ